MLTMAVGCFTGVSTDEDLRLHEPDGSDDLADQRFPPPLGHRLGSTGAVAEIVNGPYQDSPPSIARAARLSHVR